MFWINAIVIIGAVIIILSATYHLTPFKQVGCKKPFLVLLPKYEFTITDTKLMSENLNQLGFKVHKSKNNLFLRGMILGDFHAESSKLQVVFDETKKTGYIKAPFIGIFLDTGDLWSIAAQLDQKQTSNNTN